MPLDSLLPRRSLGAALAASCLGLMAVATPASAGDSSGKPAKSRSGTIFDAERQMYAGLRGGLVVPVGGSGLTPTFGLELGVSRPSGFGLGVQLIGAVDTPRIGPFDPMDLGFGIAA